MTQAEIYNLLRIALEIGILYIVIYQVLYFLRSTRGSLVLAGFFIILVTLSAAAKMLRLDVISYILYTLGGSMILALFIIFQPELRRALAQLGSYIVRQGKRRREFLGEISLAVQDMANRKCGALLVIERRMHLQNLIDDSIPLDIKVNGLVIESIFFPNSPLHDGAVIIRDDRILAARAILPLTRAENISRRLGTRHRAALGISEESDAVCVTVSEETGAISIAHRGIFNRDLTVQDMEQLLDKLVIQRDDSEFRETVRMIEEEEQDPEIIAAEPEEEAHHDDQEEQA